jgi:16S rRNA (guanine527-N7)-methyltransferase
MRMMTEILAEKLAGIFAPGKLARERLASHYAYLLKWNEKMNLTTITEVSEVAERHYAESVFVGANLPAGLRTIADIGSGPGFPGVGIAVARPEIRVTLVEADIRKMAFLKESTRGWENVEVLHRRAEQIAGREWEALTARAVRPQEVTRLMPRLAAVSYLLVGGEDVRGEAVRLPWGDERYLDVVRK